jgi:hypothetical protein
MSASDLERVVLGALVMRPQYLELEGINSADFASPRYRKIFGLISEIWEIERPEEISLSVLAERLGGDSPVEFVSNLITGLQRLTPEQFKQNVAELRWLRGTREIGRELSQELALEVRTGNPDREAWERIFERVDGLRRSTEPKDPTIHIALAERGAEAVKIRPIPWLWHGVMPTHMSTAITGDAGLGKSLVAVDLAARVSRGTAFPIYDKPSVTAQGHVFYITSEGVPEMILVPRFMAAGADLSKITIIDGVYTRNDHFSMFDITRNIPNIERRAKDFPDLILIVVDPIASFLPERINTNQGNRVRQAMDRISELAFKLGIACPTVMHFTKTPGLSAIHKTSGSVQFEASVKMSWSVIRRPDDPPNVRLLVPQKSNITGGYKSLSFSIHPVEFPAPDNPGETISTAKIVYGEHVDENPETLISPPIEKDGDAARAVEFLKRKMKGGMTLYARDILEEADSEGIPPWSVKKARVRLGLAVEKEDKFQGRFFWYMPKGKP